MGTQDVEQNMFPVLLTNQRIQVQVFKYGTIASGNKLSGKLTEEIKKRWEGVITPTNMTHNSRKSWKTIRKLSNDPTKSNSPCLVSANQVAHQLIVNGRDTIPSKPTEGDYSMVYPFSGEEYKKGVAILQNNKVAGREDVLVEQLKTLSPNTHGWLLTMLNNAS